MASDLLYAVRIGDVEKVRSLLDQYAHSHFPQLIEGFDLVMEAVRHRQRKMVEVLVSYGAKVNVTTSKHTGTPLHAAVSFWNWEIIKVLLANGADVNAIDKDGVTPLHRAVFDYTGYNKNNEATLQMAVYYELQDLIKCILQYRTDNTDNSIRAFHLAVSKFGEKSEVVEYFCQHGFTLTDDYRQLIQAVKQRNTANVEQLIKRGVDINLLDFNIITDHLKEFLPDDDIESLSDDEMESLSDDEMYSLSDDEMESFDAVLTISSKLVKLLSEHINVAFVDKVGRTYLHHIVSYRRGSAEAEQARIETLRKLIERGSDIEARDRWGRTPLHRSIENDNPEVVKLLLELGADANAKDMKHRTALHLAAKRGYASVVKILLEGGADVMAIEERHNTALQLAIERGHADVVKALLESGADVRLKDNYWSALSIAAWEGYTDVIKVIFEGGWGECLTASLKHICLYQAASQGHADIVRILLEAGVDVTARQEDHYTALHRAAERGHADIVRILLEAGAEVMARLRDHCTPLHLAAREGHAHVIRALLEAGADIMARQQDYRSAQHLAAECGYADVVMLLVENGAEVNDRDRGSDTLLHWAAEWGEVDIAKMLIEREADVNAKNTNLSTPLHLACKAYNDCILNVRVLIESGADIHSRDRDGRTPFHCWAQATGDSVFLQMPSSVIANVLLEHGADFYAVDNQKRTVLNYLQVNVNAQDTFLDFKFKLKAANLRIDLHAEVTTYARSFSNRERTDKLSAYKEELERLKTESIQGSGVAVADLLTDDLGRLTRYARNQHLVDTVLGLEIYTTTFPEYIFLVRNCLQRGLRRLRLMEQARPFFTRLITNLPYIAVEEIETYLSDQDLKCLADIC